MFTRRQILTIPEGNPVPNSTQVEMRRHSDNSLIATTQTQGGWFEFRINGNPGPHYFRADAQGEVHISSSKATGVSGALDIAHLPLFIRAFTNGYLFGVLNGLAITSAGAGMAVTLNTGAGYYQGVLYDQHSSQNLTIGAAEANPRIDLVVVRVTPPGGGTDIEGWSRVVVKPGTAAITPVAPSLTQTATVWEEPLAQVRVDPAVSSISSAAITDRRVHMNPIIGSGYITDYHLGGSIPVTKLTSGSVRSYFPGDAYILKADLDSSTPEWGLLRLAELFDVSATGATTGQALVWDGTQWAPAAVSGSGGGSVISGASSNDSNFNATGIIGSSWRTLGTASVSLPAGTWLIEIDCNFTARGGGGDGTFDLRLAGSGAPTGADESRRIFQCTGYNPRTVRLTGRRTVSPTTTTTYSSSAQAIYNGGTAPDMRDGVVFIKAYRV